MVKKKELLVFIGGAFQDIRAAFRICKELSKDFDVLVADLPGSGSAQRLPFTYPFSFLADVVAELVDHIGYKKFHMIGCSYGSPIAYNVAQRYPSMVGRLVLTGVMKEIPEHIRSAIEETVELVECGEFEKYNLRMRDIFFNLKMSKEIEKQKYLRDKFHLALQQMDEGMKRKYIDNTKRLLHTKLNQNPNVSAPILVMTGQYDNFTRPQDCIDFASMCSNAEFTFVENSDHFFHVEQPKVTINLVRAFLFGENINEIPGHGKLVS